MANDRSLGLSELARFGFVDLSGTIGKLDELVKLVGDSGRSALASLGVAADPDQALVALLNLATAQPAKTKALLKKDDSARRLCALLGASTALTDFIMRHPEQLDVFEKPHDLSSHQEVTSALIQSVEPLLKPGLLAGWIYIVIVSVRELSSSILLYSPGTEVVSIIIWEMWQNGQYVELSAFGVMLIATLFIFVMTAQWVGKRFGVKEN
jgi:hypothetical protein